MLTIVAPSVPAPGMPPSRAEARLAAPCPRSSRLESWRLFTTESVTTQVLSVSMESSTERVSAGPARRQISSAPTARSQEKLWARPPKMAAGLADMAPMMKGLPSAASSSGRASPHRKCAATPEPRPSIAAGTRRVRRGASSAAAMVTSATV